jgi:hypothetical protein
MDIATVILATGRQIDLHNLEVSRTYGTFLEGYPFAALNDRHLARDIPSLAQRHPLAGHAVVPPARTTPPDGPTGSFGPMELLPPIRCVGLFCSGPVSEDAEPVLVESLLAVAWYQETADLPMSEAARAELAKLDWDALARDVER